MMNTRSASFPLVHQRHPSPMQDWYSNLLSLSIGSLISDTPDPTQTLSLDRRDVLLY
jgi:hypothetical protein